ncbi:snRNA-activating protein complex subunit 3 [Oncorhynchus clarkii lewisi]|uniref:snRNA-activating protein complex subunit 3 n=1 Tax=Oncorhynchus clarkii lewisi TaxID=490388 RepID=UPI0039B9A0C8
MAAGSSSNVNENIPVFEYKDINTKPFHVGSFRTVWLEKLKPIDYSYEDKYEENEDADFAKEMGIAPETLDELKAICSVDTLRGQAEDEPLDTNVVPPDPTLQTLIQRKKKQDYKGTLRIDKISRVDHYQDELESLAVGKRPEDPADLVPEGEIILSINVLYPAIFERFRYVRPHMTLQMLGSHSLVDLRDAICCISDLQVFGEFSNTPDMAPDFISKDHFKSAFFYFEGVFYNDMRHPECQDMSETTIEWAKTRDFPTFHKAKMEDTRFYDLKVKVGYPYLFCHQGDCEHVVIITDIRLAHKDDCLDRKLYPLLTHKHRVMTRKCAVCHVYIGRWLTTNDPFAPNDPCLFCERCFRMLHYDEKGNKLGQFLAYPYVDPGAFN